MFLLEKEDQIEEELKEGTPRFGDTMKYQNIKFTFRNEK